MTSTNAKANVGNVMRMKEVAALLDEMAKEEGYSISQLFPQLLETAPAKVVKYRHPDDFSLVWCGKGKRPGWLRAALAAGAKVDDFAVGPEANGNSATGDSVAAALGEPSTV